MKVKVIKKFRDKESKVINHPGDNLDVSEERFNELVAAGNYVEAVEDDEESEKPTPDPEEDNNEEPGAGKEPEKPTPDTEEDNNEDPGADAKAEQPASETKKRKAGRKPSAKN